jgi:tRNA(fMet)-specific endonuclease VapC
MNEALIDTDILSEVLKRKDKQVLAAARQYLAANQRLAFSAITFYEILRGLRANQANRQQAQFLKTVSTSDVFPVSMPVLMRAAGLWGQARVNGHPHDDADLIIAATALEHSRVLVTGNSAHFAWISGLTIENWRQP